jgi:hypothetical protein
VSLIEDEGESSKKVRVMNEAELDDSLFVTPDRHVSPDSETTAVDASMNLPSLNRARSILSPKCDLKQLRDLLTGYALLEKPSPAKEIEPTYEVSFHARILYIIHVD